MIHAPAERLDFSALKRRLRAADQALQQCSGRDDARRREIFHQRAVRLAVSQDRDRATVETMPVLAFTVGAETYGIELRYVAQVFPDMPITRLPGGPETLLGVANLQGEVRSILGVRRVLSLPDGDGVTDQYIVLLRREERRVGLRVEQIEEVREIARDSLTTADSSADQSACYVQGVTPDNLIVLRAHAMFEHGAGRRD